MNQIGAQASWDDKLSFSVNDTIKGHVNFHQENPPNGPVMIEMFLKRVPEGVHGFHVHELPLTEENILSDDCCACLKSHFNSGKPIWSPDNPTGTKHGEHTGDLCFNIESNGVFTYGTFYSDKISLDPNSEHCIVGRSIVIHADRDDLGVHGTCQDAESLITGRAGSRIACANINYV